MSNEFPPPVPSPETPRPPAAPAYGAQPTAPVYGQQPYAQATPYGAAGYQPYAAAPKTNTLAIVSLVLSLVGVAIGGIITGHIALSQIKRTGEGGRGLALAGTIIGYVVTALSILGIIAYIIFIVVLVGAGAMSSEYYSN